MPFDASSSLSDIRFLQGDCLESLKSLPDQSVHTCVTSPPYFGLRDYGQEGQIGLEETPDAYVQRLVEVFREVRRVLRDDGTVWLNLGDSYAANRGYQVPSTKGGPKHGPGQAAGGKASVVPEGLKPKDLIGIPWRVAFALQADAWYLRQDVIWAKPNPMPESVRDRCTKSHEYIFLLTKSPRYFFDHEAIKEPAVSDHPSGNGFKRAARKSYQNADGSPRGNDEQWKDVGGKRNRRSVWTVTTKPFKGAHFAVFPPDLIEPCILAGTSHAGHCPSCGERWGREVIRESHLLANSAKAGRTPEEINSSGKHIGGVNGGNKNLKAGPVVSTQTVSWRPSCKCDVAPVPDVVLDPFGGAGTAGLVAQRLGRRAILCEINPDYIDLARKRLEDDQRKRLAEALS